MSGGHFEYKQHAIEDIADSIEEEIRQSGKPIPEDEKEIWMADTHYTEYSKETMQIFNDAVNVLRKARIYAHRIDWFLSGDDGEESFHKRLYEELKNLNK